MILAKAEDEPQIAANTLNKIARKDNMKISTTKTKCMAICGKNIQGSKIVIYHTIIEQVTDFIYLGNMISEFKTDITIKIHWYSYKRINGNIRRHFGKNTLPNTRLCNITSKAALKYGSEASVLNKKECQQLETAVMKFLRAL
jgi:hypothetical protein